MTSILGVDIISLMVFLPTLGAAILLLLPTARGSVDSLARQVSFFVTLITFLVSLFILFGFVSSNTDYQFTLSKEWITSFNVTYSVGIDGISLFLVLLTTFLMPIVVIASASVHNRLRGYLINMLILETAMLGTLVALDAFLFYIFWELMLVPMYFLIGIWGGKRRIYATLKFVIYTVIGSLLMLVALLYVVWQHQEQAGTVSFLIEDLTATNFSMMTELWLFAAFALAFAIKVPIFPFHTWLPDAHVEAPTGGSVVLAGILLKMGLYGFIRLAYPLFPRAAEVFAPYIAGLAVIGIIYGALVAWAQVDIKKLVAYSSVSHLGYCVLGFVAFNTMSTSGSIFQMLNHGVSTGALFLLVGVLYDRRHTREISEYGGLTSRIPLFAFLFLVFTLSSIALPLTNGFIGEFLILTGSFQSFPVLTVISTLGVILGAIYMLTLYMRTMFGEIDNEKNGQLADVNRTELAALLPLLVLVFYMGIFPNHILRVLEPTVDDYIARVEQRREDLKSFQSEIVQRTGNEIRARYIPISFEGNN